MKKINRTIVLFIFSIAFITISCKNDQEDNKNLVEPELFTNFTLSDASNDVYPNVYRNVGGGTVWTIGRKSKNCHKLGLCKLDKIIIHLNKSEQTLENNEVQSNIIYIDGNPFVIVKLDNELDSNVYDTNLYIDEDLFNENIQVNQAVIPLDNSIGNYGGYKIPLTINE